MRMPLAHVLLASPQDYIQVNVGSMELRANPNITQIVEVVEEHDKRSRLFAVLRTIPVGDRTIIFCETKKGSDDLCRQMRMNGIPALAIHGDKQQSERDWVRCRISALLRFALFATALLQLRFCKCALVRFPRAVYVTVQVLNEFRTGKSPIMIATDVASRGLDVNDIKYVINYDFPKEAEDYVHRIGRTGRKTNEGYGKGTAIRYSAIVVAVSERANHWRPGQPSLR